MKKLLTLLFALALGMHTFTSDAKAAILDAPVDPADFLNINGADWAWAGPCAPFSPSCGEIDLSFQGAQGWAIATASQIADVIAFSGGLSAFVDLFEPGNVCASRFFSNNWSHCDYSDARLGYIHNLAGLPDPNPAEEVFVVRGNLSPIPVPAALPLLLAGIGLLGAMKRRKKA